MSFKKMVLAVVVGYFVIGFLKGFERALVDAVAKDDKAYALVDGWLQRMLKWAEGYMGTKVDGETLPPHWNVPGAARWEK